MRIKCTSLDHELSPYYLMLASSLVSQFGITMRDALWRIDRQLAQNRRDANRMQLQWNEPAAKSGGRASTQRTRGD
jgi:hypothetical protein